jgi:hypothetical protein
MIDLRQQRLTPHFLTLVLGISMLACAANEGGGVTAPGGQSSTDANVSSVAGVVAALRGAGLTVTDAGRLQQPFFGPPAQVFTTDGGDLQFYEFATPEAAAAAAAEVAPGGGSIGTVSASWMAPPHFFRKERLIALYVGSSGKTIGELQRILGPQFAGR